MYKNIILVLGLLMSIAVCFSACKDEDPDPEPINPSMTAKINTPAIGISDFAATTITAATASSLLNISGAASGKSMTLSLTNNGSTGSHNISMVAGPAYATLIEGAVAFTATSGTVNVTAWDTTAKTIKGTFEFDAQSGTGAGRQITEGAFEAEY